MNLFKSIRSFFTASKEGAPVDAAVRDAFKAAHPLCDAAFQALEPYTSLANDYKKLTTAVDPADLEDLEPYTEAILDAHTDAINTLSDAFDTLTDAFAAFSPDDHFYVGAAGVYQAYCRYFTFVATAYSKAASCAMLTALYAQRQAVKDQFRAMELGCKADRADEANEAAARAKATAAEAKATEDESTAKALQEKAEHATKLAKVLLDIARHCEENAAEAVDKADEDT